MNDKFGKQKAKDLVPEVKPDKSKKTPDLTDAMGRLLRKESDVETELEKIKESTE